MTDTTTDTRPAARDGGFFTRTIRSASDPGAPAREKREVRQILLGGERALFGARDLRVVDTVFTDGESPLKESAHIELLGSAFRWKYPLWYCTDVDVRGCTWFEMARSGVWYTHGIRVRDSVIEAPKNFRRCTGVSLEDVDLPNAAETLWTCRDVRLDRVTARGDYFGMNCEDVEADRLTLVGNYPFDGARRVHVTNSRMLSKDAFWNTEDVLVEDSYIAGEYLGWNAHNLTLVNCTVESLQGLCYVDNLTMRNCRLLNTTLAFEYSSVEADVRGRVESVFNPTSGTIEADEIGELVVERDRVDPGATRIVVRGGGVGAVAPGGTGGEGRSAVADGAGE